MSRGRIALVLALLVSGLAAVTYLSLAIGAVHIPVKDVWTSLWQGGETPDSALAATIVRELRLPRILLALVMGAGLAAAGTAYQGLFRNPLADPFVIGASSGAALGASLVVVSGGGAGLVSLFAFAGALAAVALVVALGGLGELSSPATLILAGSAVSTICSAAVSLLMILHEQDLNVVLSWILGGLAGRGWSHVAYGVPAVLAGSVWSWLLSRRLDALTLGEETARSLGLSIGRTRLAVVLAATLTTAAAVSVAGIIGFVGLIAPHSARLLVGGAHRRVFPVACLLGALLLIVADDLARSLAAPLEIPLGIVTALVGGPFFLYLLRTRRGYGGGLMT